jgi:hypothetical protein
MIFNTLSVSSLCALCLCGECLFPYDQSKFAPGHLREKDI